MESTSASSTADNSRILRGNKHKGDGSIPNYNEKRKPDHPKPSSSKMQVVNLSDLKLTPIQEEVLGLGLTFSPTALILL